MSFQNRKGGPTFAPVAAPPPQKKSCKFRNTLKNNGQPHATKARGLSAQNPITPKKQLKRMIPIQVIAKRDIATQEVKYYPQIAATTPLTLPEIAERIEQRSTVSSADVKGVLGSFRPGLRVAETVGDKSAVNASTIAGVRVLFTPSSALRGMLSVKNLSFKMV